MINPTDFPWVGEVASVSKTGNERGPDGISWFDAPFMCRKEDGLGLGAMFTRGFADGTDGLTYEPPSRRVHNALYSRGHESGCAWFYPPGKSIAPLETRDFLFRSYNTADEAQHGWRDCRAICRTRRIEAGNYSPKCPQRLPWSFG